MSDLMIEIPMSDLMIEIPMSDLNGLIEILFQTLMG